MCFDNTYPFPLTPSRSTLPPSSSLFLNTLSSPVCAGHLLLSAETCTGVRLTYQGPHP